MYTANEDSWARGSVIWPGLSVPRETFQAWLEVHPSADPDVAPDQYLVCACLARVPGAIEAFSRRYLDPVDRYLGALARTPDRVDEIRQMLAVRLLVGDEGRGPALAEYGGQGSLEGWIRVSAVRMALMLERKQRPTAPIEDKAGQVWDAYDGELVFLRQHYRAHFKRALEVALTTLDPTHRVMLRLHFVEGMTTAAMATLYQMSRATLVRRLSDAKSALREGVASEIARTVTLSPDDYTELLGSVQSMLDVSIARLLREPVGPEP